MIGWKPRPFIFVHIPKSAGTSIEKALIPVVSQHQDFKDLSEDERTKFWLPGNKGLQHLKLRRYQQHYKLEKYFKFAFVRNPWDRAISQIEYLRTRAHAGILAKGTFKERLQVYCSTKRIIWGQDLGACQLDYLKDASGKLRMNFIGRFETLTADFENICILLGINQPLKLQHIFNSNRSLHYSEFYDDESYTWVKQRFSKDIDCFGYKFERPF
jgi:hypothetical protein